MKMKFFAQPIHVGWMALILSVLNTALYNVPFFNFVASHAEKGGATGFALVASLFVVMIALNFMVFYLLLKCLRWVGRGFLALTFVLSALAVYFVVNYHVMMDETMVGNVLNTHYSEASNFFRWSLWLVAFVIGVLPAVYVCIRKTNWGTWAQMGKWCGTSLAVIMLLVLVNLNQVLWIGKYDTQLGGLLMPWGYIVNTCRLYSHQADENQEEIKLPDGQFADNEKTAVVLVIGESARREDFQLYGYKRATNPRLSKVKGVSAVMAHSNATYTTAGVRCMLEPKDEGDLYEILPNYVFRSGGDVCWRTNNWGEPPVHIKEYLDRAAVAQKYGVDDHYDDALYAGIGDRIRHSNSNKVLIVVHTYTSHGPDYQNNYPKKYEVFKPVCTRVEDAHKNKGLLRNAYDNTIVYTDDCLANLIDTLRSLDGWNTAMMFMSDHGESLGENDLYMHGLPLNIAPKVQYEVPLIVWTKGNLGTLKRLKDEADQFCVFHTIIGWLGLKSEAYDESKDLFSRSRK